MFLFILLITFDIIWNVLPMNQGLPTSCGTVGIPVAVKFLFIGAIREQAISQRYVCVDIRMG